MKNVAICGMLEVGWDAANSSFEFLCWRQLKGAWQVEMALVPRDFLEMEEALDHFKGYHRIFLIRSPNPFAAVWLQDLKLPEGPVVYVFGRPGENLVRYVRPNEDTVASINTANTDMMAVSAAGIVLYEHRQSHNH